MTMTLALIAGTAHPALAASMAATLGIDLVPVSYERFPDGEQHVALRRSVRGEDVYIVQPMSSPVDERLMELLLLADAARRAGAGRVTAVAPYLGYARQDRRKAAGEPISARVVGGLLQSVGVDRLVTIEPHSATLEAMYPIPVLMLTAVPALAEALRASIPSDAVVVSPDLGAVRLAERYGAALGLPVAVVRKQRLSGSEVRVQAVAGEVAGRHALIVDDMITTGGTIEAAVSALIQARAIPPFLVAATHAVLVGPAEGRLGAPEIGHVWVTDTLQPRFARLSARVVEIGPLLTETVRRLHAETALDDLEART